MCLFNELSYPSSLTYISLVQFKIKSRSQVVLISKNLKFVLSFFPNVLGDLDADFFAKTDALVNDYVPLLKDDEVACIKLMKIMADGVYVDAKGTRHKLSPKQRVALASMLNKVVEEKEKIKKDDTTRR